MRCDGKNTVYVTSLLCSTIKYTISLLCTLSLNGQCKQIREVPRDNELEKLKSFREDTESIIFPSETKEFKLRNCKCSLFYYYYFFFLSPLSVDMFVEYRSVYIMGAREIGNTILLSLITHYQNTVLN